MVKNKKKLLHAKMKKKKSSPTFNDYIDRLEKNNGKRQIVWISEKTPPQGINLTRQTIAIHATKRKLDAPTGRMKLYEYKNQIIHVEGLVSDISTEKNEMDRSLLIENPTILDVLDNQHSNNNAIGVNIDGHIWIKLSNIIFSRENRKISIGDTITFLATVNEYKGRTDHGLYGYKYGLVNIGITGSGIYVRQKRNKQTAALRSDYPRGDDWVVKIDILEHTAKHEKLKITTQKSKYPHYFERMEK